MERGFTLIELLVTLVVLVVVLSLGVPSFVLWLQNSRIDTSTRTLAGALQEARSVAVSRQTTVTLGAGTTGNLGDWTEGIHIYTDADAAGNTAYVAASDTLTKDMTLSMSGIEVSTNTSGNNYISFTSDGLLNEAGNVVQMALCDNRGVSEGKLITLNVVGRVSISDADNGMTTCTP